MPLIWWQPSLGLPLGLWIPLALVAAYRRDAAEQCKTVAIHHP